MVLHHDRGTFEFGPRKLDEGAGSRACGDLARGGYYRVQAVDVRVGSLFCALRESGREGVQTRIPRRVVDATVALSREGARVQYYQSIGHGDQIECVHGDRSALPTSQDAGSYRTRLRILQHYRAIATVHFAVVHRQSDDPARDRDVQCVHREIRALAPDDGSFPYKKGLYGVQTREVCDGGA